MVSDLHMYKVGQALDVSVLYPIKLGSTLASKTSAYTMLLAAEDSLEHCQDHNLITFMP